MLPTTKYPAPSGSNPSDSPIHLSGQFSPRSDHTDEIVEYLHEVDVCAEEDFWWDEEDRHEI